LLDRSDISFITFLFPKQSCQFLITLIRSVHLSLLPFLPNFFLRFSVRVFLSIIYCVKPFIEHETMSEKGTRLEICSNFSQKSVGIISECHFQHDNKLIPFFLILICHSTITVIFSHFLTSKKETLK